MQISEANPKKLQISDLRRNLLRRLLMPRRKKVTLDLPRLSHPIPMTPTTICFRKHLRRKFLNCFAAATLLSMRHLIPVGALQPVSRKRQPHQGMQPCPLHADDDDSDNDASVSAACRLAIGRRIGDYGSESNLLPSSRRAQPPTTSSIGGKITQSTKRQL